MSEPIFPDGMPQFKKVALATEPVIAPENPVIRERIPELVLGMVDTKNPYHHEINRILYMVLQDEDVRRHMAELHDNRYETFCHCVRVAAIAIELSNLAGAHLQNGELAELARSALVHDVGKCGIPTAILDKPERLTSDEVAILDKHVSIGRAMLSGQPKFRETAKIVEGHHMHQKRSYGALPEGAVGILISQLIAAADNLDALQSPRPYKKALPPDVVEGEIRANLKLPGPIEEAILKMARRG